MRKFKVREDCFCERYLHELKNYYHSNLVEKKLFQDDEVYFVKEWGNFYGKYFRVKKDDNTYDIPPNKLIEII